MSSRGEQTLLAPLNFSGSAPGISAPSGGLRTPASGSLVAWKTWLSEGDSEELLIRIGSTLPGTPCQFLLASLALSTKLELLSGWRSGWHTPGGRLPGYWAPSASPGWMAANIWRPRGARSCGACYGPSGPARCRVGDSWTCACTRGDAAAWSRHSGPSPSPGCGVQQRLRGWAERSDPRGPVRFSAQV